MNPIVLVLAGLVHHWRTHLGVAAGFTLAATVLTGALLVGDSARGSLRERALARIGSADVALVGGERLLREIRSDIRFRITALFAENGIVIAFPQRDVHFDMSAPLDVRLLDSKS